MRRSPQQASRHQSRHWRAPLIALLAAVGAVAVGGQAGAASDVAMAVDVKASEQVLARQDGGNCTWRVAGDVIVVNLTDESVAISEVSNWVSWTGPEGTSGVQTNVTTVDSADLVPGTTLAPDERRTFSGYTVEFVIPCTADEGDLAVRITGPNGTGSGDAPFLTSGAPVPPAAFGAAGLSAFVGLALVLGYRRRKRALALTLTPEAVARLRGRVGSSSPGG